MIKIIYIITSYTMLYTVSFGIYAHTITNVEDGGIISAITSATAAMFWTVMFMTFLAETTQKPTTKNEHTSFIAVWNLVINDLLKSFVGIKNVFLNKQKS